ncbi:hypothetical protein [Paenibacillus sp. FSL E2-0178]
MEYNNIPDKSLESGEILHFIQQCWIWAGIWREMLYYVQHFRKSQLETSG